MFNNLKLLDTCLVNKMIIYPFNILYVLENIRFYKSILAASAPPYYFPRIPDIFTRSCLYITFKEDAEIGFPITPFNTQRQANYSHE